MKMINFSALVVSTIVFCLSAVGSVHAQTGVLLTVNNNGDTNDAVPGDHYCADSAGRCTLRAAVEEANTNSNYSAIIFDLPNPCAIDLTLGELSIQKNLEIVGPGARRVTVRRSTASGTPNFRVFRFPAGKDFASVRGLTITNGNAAAGGGILIESGRTVLVADSALRGNNALNGGAISVAGKLSVLHCLIDSNIAADQGGAIKTTAGGSDTTVTSSTLTGNSAAVGGAIHNEGSLLLVNGTISANGASAASSSIYSGSAGTVKVINTIIGRDTGQTVSSLSGVFQSLGGNIVTDSTGSTGFTNGVNGDQVSQNNAINPLLGPLADNGGQTDTFALLQGSPAINTGNGCARNGPCEQLPGVFFSNGRDQRHALRSPGANMDVGAFAVNTAIISPNATSSFSFSGLGEGAKHYGSIVTIIDATTLAKRYTLLKLGGRFDFRGLPLADVYVIEIKSKRAGMQTPFVFASDR